MTDPTPEIEPDNVPDIVPDITPDTPAEEAPAVPDTPKDDTNVPDATSKLEKAIETLGDRIEKLETAIIGPSPVETLQDDDSPKPKPWTHRGFGKHD